MSHSVMTEDDFELRGRSTSTYLSFLGAPTMPGTGTDGAAFYAEMEDFVYWQIQRRATPGASATVLLPGLPDLWSGFSIAEAAEAVRADPGSLQAEFIQVLFRDSNSRADREDLLDESVMPFRSQRDFIGMEIRLTDLNTWAVGLVASIKVGHAQKIFSTRFSLELSRVLIMPESLKMKVDSFTGITKAEDFTAYAIGCPLHPAWPAMHSAASSASLWLATVPNLSSSRYCEALRLDYAVSFARTVAGVHYASDNIDGLNFGTKLLQENLASHLATQYGGNQNTIQAKIDRFVFDWADFDPVSCSINGRPF